jgi:hypothetical protein
MDTSADAHREAVARPQLAALTAVDRLQHHGAIQVPPLDGPLLPVTGIGADRATAATFGVEQTPEPCR